MSAITFTVPGDPKGKGRPKFRRQGNGVVTYTPPETVAYERTVMWVAKAAMCGRKPLSGPVCVSIVAYFTPARSATKAQRAAMLAGQVRPKRIDCDNIAKAVLDGSQGVALVDDVDVVSLAIVKAFSETPRVEVRVWPFNPDAPLAAQQEAA